ncbi:transcriptional regulator [Pestalotiopsis sp. IQ-011]
MSSPPNRQGRKITVVGGSGNIGSHIVSALAASGIHEVSVISRPESTAKLPASVTVRRGAYDDETFLVSALAGQDALVVALGFQAMDAQVPLIRAAARAGVPYVVPCEFGSDPTNEPLCREVFFMNAKKPYRDLIEALGASSWVGVVNNPWFDYCLPPGFFEIDVKKRTATYFDGGSYKANLTTMPRVGASLSALLSQPEPVLSQHKNSFVYFSSFSASQRDIVSSAQRATGTSDADWTLSEKSTASVLEWSRAETAQGNLMAAGRALFALAFTEGYGGDYSDRVVDYAALGLEAGEDLDEVMRRLVAEMGA